MKFGGQVKLTNTQRIAGLIIAVIAAFLIFKDLQKDFDVQVLLIGFFGAIIALLPSPYLRNMRNRDRPMFEIKDDILYYKTHWGSIKEYPLKNFNGKVETSKILFEEYLKTPNLTLTKNSLYIGVLDKGERKDFLNTLIKHVGDDKQKES